MRSLALLRLSAATLGAAVLGVVTVQLTNLSVALPLDQLRAAWTLTRLLIQL